MKTRVKTLLVLLLIFCLMLPGCESLGGNGGSSLPEISYEVPSKPEKEESSKTEASGGESSAASNPEGSESSAGNESEESSLVSTGESSSNSSESSAAESSSSSSQTESSSSSSQTESSSSSSSTETSDGRSFYEQYGYYGESWIGSTHVKIVGVDTALDYYGVPVVRFFIETYSERNRIVTPTDEYSLGCFQDGEELQRSYPDEKYRMPDDEYMFRDMAGGTTQRYAVSFTYNPNGGPLNLRFFNYDGTGYEIFVGTDEIQTSVAVFEPEMVDYPLVTLDLPRECTTPNGAYTFKIGSYEMTKNWEGMWTIRVFFTFTNNIDAYEPAPFDVLSALAFQDGLSLFGTYTEEEAATDKAGYMTKTAVGATTEFSECFVLMGDSPVEVILTPHNNIFYYEEGSMAGAMIELQ